MAAGNECAEATRVLLVDPQSLPVLLHSDSEGNARDISVDLLQQALQGTSAIDDGNDEESGEEVSLDALAGGNNDVVAIYQGEEGQTHTIKISLAEAQSLGLQFATDSYPLSLSNGSLLSGVKVVSDQLSDNHSSGLNNASLLQSVSCSNVAADGRIIDEEGNIVQTTEGLQILPTTLSSFLDEGMNQSLSIIPQYELDGTVTYAVKLKDQNDTVLGTDYHILEPDTSAKTGLDIEEELKNSNLKQNILHSAESISAESIRLATSVSLNSDTSSATSTIQVPISTLEALSKQMLLPSTSSSVPISMTLSIPTQTSVPSHSSVSSSTSLATSNANRFFQLVTDHSSVGLNNVIAADTTVPLSTIVSQPTLNVNPHLISQSTSMMNVQRSPALTILGNSGTRSLHSSRQHILSEKLQPILPLPKNHQGTHLKTVTALRKLPIPANAVAPSTINTSSINSPVMAPVAPQSSQLNFGGASSLKTMQLSNARVSSSTSNLSKPLGSSENPIQLVQQGQTFHSMQALSQAQLRQIATVLQQKHLNSNSVTSKNVLFDEQTKTRIVYRVVYPEDVDLQQPSSPTEIAGGSVGQSSKNANRLKGKPKGRPKKGRRTKQLGVEKHPHKLIQVTTPSDTSRSLTADAKKSNLREENGQQDEVPKIEKKKVLGSRTRSGRVSRPPKHMMKDFKRLHHTDFRERDGDDSDGGYSDYSNPDQALDKPPLKEVEMNLSPAKKKFSRFTCPTCGKLYLGLGRMEKHYLQNPDHGSFEEFKQHLAAVTASDVNNAETFGDKEIKNLSAKGHSLKGKKRTQGFSQSEKERSEVRKKRLKQALEACEISEVLEIAGPLIARYYSLWDLLVLRLLSREESNLDKDAPVFVDSHKDALKVSQDQFNSQTLPTVEKHDDFFRKNCNSGQNIRSTNNRVQWLLMELGSLADTLKSVAGDLFQPALLHSDEKTHVKISQKDISEFLGVSCGLYSVNEEHLCRRMESISGSSKQNSNDDLVVPPEKRSRKLDDPNEFNLNLAHEAPVCPATLSSLSLMVKPGDDKVMLTEDMPFLNSSDDMICGSEDLSTDSKRDQDCDPAAGMQVVDDIVNERLKNLSDNMNFSVPLQGELETSDMNGQQTDLHLMSSFGAASNSISVSHSSVISNNLADNSKPSASVSNMDLISSYSMPSLTRPATHDINISNSEPSNDLANALEPVTSQSMLGNFGMGLSSLSSFDPLQSQSSAVSHSDDSFLESLSSFETPLTQSCDVSSAPGSTFSDSIMKSNGLLQLGNETSPEPSRLPPKFISSFTPAITNEKSTTTISTAQRLQRTYLELDSGLDDGMDLDFEAFTQELSMNQNNNT